MRREKIRSICLSVVLMIGACTLSGDGKKIQKTMEITPVIDQQGADPWIWEQNGMYYYTKTTGDNVTILRSRNLSDIAAGEKKVVFDTNDELASFWAPEIYYLDDVWYVYFAAVPFGSEVHRMYVLVNENEDPFEGIWECQELRGMDDKFAIDGTVLNTGSRKYFIWSGWEGYENIRQNLYIARMVSPTEIEKEKILLSQPQYEWEQNGNPLVNEGPEALVRGETVNLVYSASGSWTDSYCMGLLTASVNDDLCDPSVWRKYEEPIFFSQNDVIAPGHNGFAVSPDGKEIYMIYHSARWKGAGWNRFVRLHALSFDENGAILGSRLENSNELIKAPGGEAERLQSRVEEIVLSEGLSVGTDKDSRNGEVITGFENEKQTASWEIYIPVEGSYSVFIYAKIKQIGEDGNAANVKIQINNCTYNKEVYPAACYQPVCFKGDMEKGINVISVSFEYEGGGINLDRIELLPAEYK